jgi:flagellar hook assembly protein FlgD
VISPLPGGTYRRLDMAADGTRLVLSSDLGGVMVDIPLAAGEGSGSLETVYLYPNPFPGDPGSAQLNLGGLELQTGQTVTIEILNTAGEVVHLASDRLGVLDLWDGRNRQGRRVAAGLYLVKITLADRVVVKTLAVNY